MEGGGPASRQQIACCSEGGCHCTATRAQARAHVCGSRASSTYRRLENGGQLSNAPFSGIAHSLDDLKPHECLQPSGRCLSCNFCNAHVALLLCTCRWQSREANRLCVQTWPKKKALWKDGECCASSSAPGVPRPAIPTLSQSLSREAAPWLLPLFVLSVSSDFSSIKSRGWQVSN